MAPESALSGKSVRPYGVVVYGATGFTGQLVAEHLLRTYGPGDAASELRWAIAGRSVGKLEAVKAELERYVPGAGAARIAVLVADSGDSASLERMTAQTDVVVSTVGPFMRFGEPLVKACATTGTEYVDSTGETPYIVKMMTQYGPEAKAKGLRFVPSCGYDSLPSDMSVLTLVDGVAKRQPGAKVGQVTHLIGPFAGTASGGTISTVIHMLTGTSSEDRKLVGKVMRDPYALVARAPGTPAPGDDVGDQWAVKRHSASGLFTAPWIMASGNERLVRQSAALNGYGPQFRYLEVLAFRSMLRAVLSTAGIGLGVLLLLLPPTRWLLQRFVLPDPGQGPTRDAQTKGFAVSSVHARVNDKHYVVECRILGGDPGYKSTGMMLAESAIALHRSKRPALGEGGFFTPASCPGMKSALVKTLAQKCHIDFEFFEPATEADVQRICKGFDTKYSKRSLL